MADHLLDLMTLIEQPTIKINGVTHEILHPDQLGVLDFQRLSTMAGRVSVLMKTPEPSDADAEELTAIIKNLTDRIMVGVPADVRAKLTEAQRLAVAEVFMTLPRVQSRKARRRQAMKEQKPSSAGSKPQSGASDSSAEARPDG